MGYYLAIDIGETAGHHILGHLENGKLQIEEIYQFKNRIVEIEGKKCWDLFYAFNEIKKGCADSP